MLKMIPASIGDSAKSNAERKIYNRLKEADIEGYCIHSVGLKDHCNKPYGEIDFVIISSEGILCLEVKGGRVACNNGIWSYTNRHGETSTKSESPFRQAIGAMYSIKDTLCSLGNINYACGVIFTDIEFSSNSIEAIKEITMDASFEGNLEDFILSCHEYWNSRFRYITQPLNDDQIEIIRQSILDDLCFVPLLSLYAEEAEQDLVRLTDEQCDVLNIARNNSKLLISGPAGSGKTLLAMEYARIKEREGAKVLFLTYNKHLAYYLASNNHSDNIKITNFHGLISEHIPLDETNKNSLYYEKTLPALFYKYLASRKPAAYDVLILDEGQDLLREEFLACLDKLLKGTISYGRWAIFYDSNQNIFNKSFLGNLKKVQKYQPAELVLTKNCRNVKQIAEFNAAITGVDTGRAIVEGVEINLVPYTSDQMCIEAINSTILYLLDQGFCCEDIVIISPTLLEKSIISTAEPAHSPVAPNEQRDGIRYYTIQSFKGLESKIVFFVDYKKIIETSNTQLLYTSLSRAKALLYLFLDEDTLKEVHQRID